MRKLFYLFVYIATTLFAETQIATAEKNGVYYPFGEEISRLCGEEMGGLDVLPTKGSLDNLQKIITESKVKFAIVQYDSLLHILNSGKYNNDVIKAIKKLRIVMPLYNEEIHIITKKSLNIKSLKDFKNLRVSVGKKGSGSYITALNIATYTGVTWAKTYTKGIKESLNDIINNKLDAVIYVAGSPSKILDVHSNMEHFALYKDTFNMYDISKNKKLENVYSLSTLLKDDYQWMDKSVDTRSVKAVLIANNYEAFQPSYKKVQKLYECIYKNIETLQTPSYHEKWKEVDTTDFQGIHWKVHPAVEEFLKTLKQKKIKKQPVKKKMDKSDENLNLTYILVLLFILSLVAFFIIKKKNILANKVAKKKPEAKTKILGLVLTPNNSLLPEISNIHNNEMIIGRSNNCDVSIDNVGVSNQHLKLFILRNLVEVTDLGSTNGTYIDGQKLTPHKTYNLEAGEKLLIGGEDVVYSIKNSKKMDKDIIVLISEDSKFQNIKGEGILGRSKDCDIVVDNTNVSRKHLKLEKTGAKIFITDLGSTNGTFIDGNELEKNEKTELCKGSKLVIGSEDVVYRLA